jgi:hypothetical protein
MNGPDAHCISAEKISESLTEFIVDRFQIWLHDMIGFSILVYEMWNMSREWDQILGLNKLHEKEQHIQTVVYKNGPVGPIAKP